MPNHRRLRLAALSLAASTTVAAPAAHILPSAQALAPATLSAEGTNLALARNGGTVTASGQEVSGQWGPELAIDGLGPTNISRWSSNPADDAWITVKLAEPTVIDHVTIAWEAACAARYALQVSADGATFTDATDVISPTCGTRDQRTLTKVEAGAAYQYVRMQSLDRTPINGVDYGVSLWEFEVWNGPEPAKTINALDHLVPLPAQAETTAGEPYALTAASRIVADPSLPTASAALGAALRPATGYPLTVATGSPSAADIALVKGPVTGHDNQPEAYSLTASATGVVITAATDHGAFNGVQTLRQLLPAFAASATPVRANWQIPAVRIVDAPRLANRGVQLDVARSFIPVEEVKQTIDAMASLKLNELHLHLSDDQGWRIEITNEGKAAGDPIDYSLLTSVSGQTAMTDYGPGVTGFYTQDDYASIVQYAAAHQITVVPEIDAPAHTNAILHAIPQMNTANTQPRPDPATGTAPANGTGNVGYSTLDANAEITWTFLRHVYGQLAAMTPGGHLHIGGDESHVTSEADYRTFVAASRELVHSLGRKSVAWNESTVAGVGPDDVIQYWYGDLSGTRDAVNNSGAKVLATPGQQAYVDQKYTNKTPIGLTWLGAGDVPRYYNWDPAAAIGVSDDKIWGVEAVLWSETVRGGSQAQFLVFPRAAAIAEVGWTPQAKRTWDSFATRLGNLGARLLAGGTNFYDSATVPWSPAVAGLTATATAGSPASLSLGRVAAPGTTLDGDNASVSTDTVDDADGPSWTTLDGPLRATIAWGDGSTSAAAFAVLGPQRDALHAGSVYAVTGTHTYAAAGTMSGRITFSDGSVAPFTVVVS